MLFKKFTLPKMILVIIVFTVFLVLALVFFRLRNTQKYVENTANISDIANWLVLVNRKYNYYIKYPPKWNVLEGNEEPYCVPDDNGPCGKYTTIFFETPSGYAAPLGIAVFYNKQRLPLFQKLKERGWLVERDCEVVVVNENRGLKCNLSFWFENKDLMYWIYWSGIPLDTYKPFVDELREIIPGINFSEPISEPDILLLEERVMAKFVSTFRILED